MSISINIQGTVIDFPSDSASPDWAEGVIAFAQAVASALSGAVGPADISPQVMNIDAQNPTSTNVDITNLSFSTTTVRAATISIATYRTTDSTSAYEFDTIMVTYNSANSIGQKWEMIREYEGNGSITFNITDTGQVQFTTTALSGTNHAGILSYSAKALLNT